MRRRFNRVGVKTIMKAACILLVVVYAVSFIAWHIYRGNNRRELSASLNRWADRDFEALQQHAKTEGFTITPRDPSQICVIALQKSEISINGTEFKLPIFTDSYINRPCYHVPADKNARKITVTGLKTANPSGKILLLFADGPFSTRRRALHWCNKAVVAVAVGNTVDVNISKPSYTEEDFGRIDMFFAMGKERALKEPLKIAPHSLSEVCVFANPESEVAIDGHAMKLPRINETDRCYHIPVDANAIKIRISGLRTENPSKKMILEFADGPLLGDYAFWSKPLSWCSKFPVAVAVGETVDVAVTQAKYAQEAPKGPFLTSGNMERIAWKFLQIIFFDFN